MSDGSDTAKDDGNAHVVESEAGENFASTAAQVAQRAGTEAHDFDQANVCPEWYATGNCVRGDSCQFLHVSFDNGYPDGGRTELQGPRLCQYFFSARGCIKGANCNYLHYNPALLATPSQLLLSAQMAGLTLSPQVAPARSLGLLNPSMSERMPFPGAGQNTGSPDLMSLGQVSGAPRLNLASGSNTPNQGNRVMNRFQQYRPGPLQQPEANTPLLTSLGALTPLGQLATPPALSPLLNQLNSHGTYSQFFLAQNNANYPGVHRERERKPRNRHGRNTSQTGTNDSPDTGHRSVGSESSSSLPSPSFVPGSLAYPLPTPETQASTPTHDNLTPATTPGARSSHHVTSEHLRKQNKDTSYQKPVKTKPCDFYNTPRGCLKGAHCDFIHMKQQICTYFFSPRGCRKGIHCDFQHPVDDLAMSLMLGAQQQGLGGPQGQRPRSHANTPPSAANLSSMMPVVSSNGAVFYNYGPAHQPHPGQQGTGFGGTHRISPPAGLPSQLFPLLPLPLPLQATNPGTNQNQQAAQLHLEQQKFLVRTLGDPEVAHAHMPAASQQ